MTTIDISEVGHGTPAEQISGLQQAGIPGLLAVGPYPPPFGGIASNLKDLGLVLGPLGFRLHVLTFTTGPESQDNPDPGVETTRARARLSRAQLRAIIRRPIGTIRALGLWISSLSSGGRRSGAAFLRAARVAACADETGLQVVSVYGTHEGAIVPYLKRLRPGLRVIYWVYAGPLIEPETYLKPGGLFSRAVREADLIASPSRYCAGAATAMSASAKAEVVYVGVDLDRFHPDLDAEEVKSKLGLPSGKVVMFLARMEPEMGALNALSIAQDVGSNRSDVTFLICGAKGSLTPQIEAAAAASNGQIKALVNVPFDDLPNLYAASDIVMAPTVGTHACMGVSVKEAMAVGKPVLVSDSGGLPEAIRDEVDGHIIPLLPSGQIDNPGFAARIDELINQPEQLTAMGASARERAEKMFSRESSATGLLRLVALAGGVSDLSSH